MIEMITIHDQLKKREVTTMKLRDYRPADEKGVLLLHEEFTREFFEGYHGHTAIEHWNSEMKKHGRVDSHYWVIDNGGEITGLVGVIFLDGQTAELVRMRVKKEYRRQGLGKKLLDKVEKHCRQAGKRELILHTEKRLISARRMYESFGFRLIGELQDVVGEYDFTIMNYFKQLI